MEKIRWYETGWRSLIKSVTYRFVGTFTTAVIVFCLTGTWKMAMWAGALEFVSKILIYWAYERLWDRIPTGRREKV